MPLKIRYALPSGAGDVTVDDDATVRQVITAIEKEAGTSVAAVKCGWPLKSLEVDQVADQSVTSLGLQRERLTVVLAEAPPATESDASQLRLQAPSAGPSKLSKDDVPVLSMPESGSFLTMRVMEDDNSCMFRAVLPTIRDAATRKGIDVSTPAKLRLAIAAYITEHSDQYNQVILEKTPDAYIHNLLDENTWGGSIELGIISELFDIEVCVINVGTGRAMHMGENKASRCVVVWSGIHYDRIVEVYDEHAAAADADFESCVWDATASDHIVETAQRLCMTLKQRGYFTDMAAAVFRCNACMETLVGEKAVAVHFEKTGHTNMEEIPDHGN